jgi:hypothetical protein
MANPTNPFSWQMPTSTDLVTDLPADFEVFGQAVATSMADLLGGTTGQVLSKTSNTDMDFTWVTTDDTNAIQNAIVDAKGDLIAASAADTPARLAVGANGTTLIAASGETTGLKWEGAWTTWTPTIANFVRGNGTETARYSKVGNIVYLYYRFVFGSTSSLSGRPEISLPVNQSYSQIIAPVRILDFGTTAYFGMAILAGNTAYVELQATNGTYSVQAFPSATTPMTWTTSDEFAFQATYEVAP